MYIASAVLLKEADSQTPKRVAILDKKKREPPETNFVDLEKVNGPKLKHDCEMT